MGVKNRQSVRYRYILCGVVNDYDKISDFRLIANNNLGSSSSAIRVIIPSDMRLEKLSCDSYSTTDDKRTLLELGYDIVIKVDGKWIVRNDLKDTQPHNFHERLRKEEIYPTRDGYMTKDKYKQYMDKLYR